MMTVQRKRRLRDKIQTSRGRLMESNPFFGLLLMYMQFVAVPGMKNMSTDGISIYFSPDFLDRLYDSEVDFILCHQIVHIISGHIWRLSDRQDEDYHFACDIKTNAHLTACGFKEERYPHLGEVHCRIPRCEDDPSEMTPEEIYGSLPYSLYMLDEKARSRYLVDSDLWWDKEADSDTEGEIIIEKPEAEGQYRNDSRTETDSSGAESLRQEWQSRTAAAVSSMEGDRSDSEGAGAAPDFAKRMIEKIRKPDVDWRKVLDNFIQERICDYSFSPPDRRFYDTGFFLPDFNEKEFVSKDVLFMVDTSGSIDDDELSAVYSEICGAAEQFGGKLRGMLGFFDSAVTPPLPFETVGDLMKIIPYGGGGTDFSVIFDYVRSNYKEEEPACIVIFTDGQGIFPAESAAMGIPVLWVINDVDITPPWGRVTHIMPV